jgi:hypothetical protein
MSILIVLQKGARVLCLCTEEFISVRDSVQDDTLIDVEESAWNSSKPAMPF